jgi:hypothetical protein
MRGRWLWLDDTIAARPKWVAVGDGANALIFAHFSLPSDGGRGARSVGAELSGFVHQPGEHLADYVLVFDDGTEHRTPVRRRFEVNDLVVAWGHLASAARPHWSDELRQWRGPHDTGRWGRNQQSSEGSGYDGAPTYWLYALINPDPGRRVVSVRLEPIAGSIAIGGITAFQGPDHPLRHRPLETMRISLRGPQKSAEPRVDLDLGVLGHRRRQSVRAGDAWLGDAPMVWRDPALNPSGSDFLLEAAANEAATLAVDGRPIAMADVYSDGRAETVDGRVHVELLRRPDLWVKGVVVDAATGLPTAARVHVHSADGRYLPPAGHRREINDGWFEDYGSDLQVGATQYAYVDGKFDLLLPAGDVYVEVTKGFEYRPLRMKVPVHPGQTEMRLTLARPVDWRVRGWVTADTHVHFLSPQTASLEAQAEGVNVVNLLAAQWGDLFTNVGDFTGAASRISNDDTIVWVGTENRQHFLGHMSLLGGRGSPVLPMSAGGPSESFVGDPVWSTLADWADACHEREGIAVIPHFPVPYCEVVADVVLGKVDGVEIADLAPGIETDAMREWYRLLNAGFRVAAVGGTDKMDATVPIGGVRTYARIGDAPLSFAAWAEAVRGGRTFTTSGPLIDLAIDGHGIGDQVRVGRSGASIEVVADALCHQPLEALEIVFNGRVVAREEATTDAYHLHLETRIRVPTDEWVAARCGGRSATYRPFWMRRPIATAAHTSPVYLVGTGIPNDSADLGYLRTIIDGGLTWLDTLATQASPGPHERARGRFLEARRRLGTPSPA